MGNRSWAVVGVCVVLATVVACAGLQAALSPEDQNRMRRLGEESEALRKMIDDARAEIKRLKEEGASVDDLLPLLDRVMEAQGKLANIKDDLEDIAKNTKNNNWQIGDWISYILVSLGTYVVGRKGRRGIEALSKRVEA